MQNLPLILVADAKPRSTREVSLALGREGFRVVAVPEGRQAMDHGGSCHGPAHDDQTRTDRRALEVG